MRRSLESRSFCCGERFMLPTLITAAVCIVLLASARSDAGEPAKSISSNKLYKVKTFRNITYHEVPHDPERTRHQLDVFRPKEETGRPVLFFIHGGGWTIGGKDIRVVA
jgi:acetyl esterase/lipase